MTQAVVITGASFGIGRTTARRISDAGYRVINLDRAACDDPEIHTLRIDLANSAALRSALNEIVSEFEIVALVNNAGFAQARALEDTDDDLLNNTFGINLRCPAECARLVVPAMKRRGYGRIINIASRSALGRELRTAYAASKGGLISMTRVWALELARYGITANCVAPGPIATDLFDQMNPDGSERRHRMIRDIPVGRIGTPDDVANAVCFFLSSESGFVNGQTLYVCGGLSVGVAPL